MNDDKPVYYKVCVPIKTTSSGFNVLVKSNKRTLSRLNSYRITNTYRSKNNPKQEWYDDIY